MSPRPKLSQEFSVENNPVELIKVTDKKYLVIKNLMEQILVKIPPKGTAIALTIDRCKFHNIPYIIRSSPNSYYCNSVQENLRHNSWVMADGNHNSTTPEQVLQNLKDLQGDEIKTITMVVS